MFPKEWNSTEAASHCPGEKRGVKRGYGKERLHESVCRKIGNCDTLCQRKYAEKHSIVEKHRFQGDDWRELYHEALYRRKDHMDGKE